MEITASAHRHGIADDDIRHALHNAVHVFPGDVTIAVGGDRNGRLIEVGYVERADEVIVIHAMPARPKFLE